MTGIPHIRAYDLYPIARTVRWITFAGVNRNIQYVLNGCFHKVLPKHMIKDSFVQKNADHLTVVKVFIFV